MEPLPGLPLGETTGPSPVDRAKSGTKRSVLTDRWGAPLAMVTTGANTLDKTVAIETVDGLMVLRLEESSTACTISAWAKGMVMRM